MDEYEDDIEELSWGVVFPLPFRVLFLAGLGILGWGTNLHFLKLMGIDVVTAMDLRVDRHLNGRRPGSFRTIADVTPLYEAVYRIFSVYCLWYTLSWATFRLATHGSPEDVDGYNFIPALSALVVLVVLFCPLNICYRDERRKFLL
jgi:hypothetical protein